MAEAESAEVPLSSFVLPTHAGLLLFFRPERFPDRASVRNFVRGEEFGAWMAVLQQVVIGGVGVPATSGPIPEIVLERAQVAAHAVLGDVERLAQVAAERDGARGEHCAAGGAGPDRRVAGRRGGGTGTLAADLRRIRRGRGRRGGLVSRPQTRDARGASGSLRDGQGMRKAQQFRGGPKLRTNTSPSRMTTVRAPAPTRWKPQ